MEIQFIERPIKKEKPDPEQLGFGHYFTDYMFQMDYSPKEGWHNAQISPYQPIEMDPACVTLHYAQTVFEGLKAYRNGDSVHLFRPADNFRRLNISNKRLAIPEVDVDFCVEALKQLVSIERDWIPEKIGTSLYIRPFVFATDAFLGVHPSKTYKLMIILSPCGSYYAGGLAPVKIYVEDQYVRSVEGGLGFTKAGANYAASLEPQKEAEAKGYEQVLWLDGETHQYIEEVGSMNIFFKVNGKVITPQLHGSILDGITRRSVLELLKMWGIPVEERRISIAEIYEAYEKGQLEEVFGTGTAAVISPVGELCWKEKKFVAGDGNIGSIAQRLYDTITGIQYGSIEDTFHWVTTL